MKKISSIRTILWLAIALPVTGTAQFNRKPLSHADSASAIRSFQSSAGGSGFQYTYHVTNDWKIRGRDSVSIDTMSVSFTGSRNSCTDMSILGVKVRILGHAATPLYSLWIYPQTKNYALKIRDTSNAIVHDRQTYQATKIGVETINGYPCIHARLTTSSSRGRGTPVTQDIWASTDIPGYAIIRQMMTLQNVTPGMMQALEQAGCNGVFIKMTMQSAVISTSMVLVRAGAMDLPASLFELPSGYTPASAGGFFGGIL
jgi:hypothetical protein